MGNCTTKIYIYLLFAYITAEELFALHSIYRHGKAPWPLNKCKRSASPVVGASLPIHCNIVYGFVFRNPLTSQVAHQRCVCVYLLMCNKVRIIQYKLC